MLWKIIDTENELVIVPLRLALGIVFLAHGCQLMLGWFGGDGFHGTMAGFTHGGIPAPFAFLAIAAEFFGGLGLLLGLLGRIAAFGILCTMVVAIYRVHRHFGFFMNWTGRQRGEGFEFHLLAIALALAIIIRGSGAFSFDRLLTRWRSRSPA